ncbi:hypothetical protein IC582_019859 [Cucumis melo]
MIQPNQLVHQKKTSKIYNNQPASLEILLVIQSVQKRQMFKLAKLKLSAQTHVEIAQLSRGLNGRSRTSLSNPTQKRRRRCITIRRITLRA